MVTERNNLADDAPPAVESRTSPRRGAGLRKETVYLAGLGAAVLVLGGLFVAAQRQRGLAGRFNESPMIFGKPEMAQATPTAKLPSNYAGFDPAALARGYEELKKPQKPDAATPATREGGDPTRDDAEQLRLQLAQMRVDLRNQQRDSDRSRAMAEYEAAMSSPLLFKTVPVVRPGEHGGRDERGGPVAMPAQGGGASMMIDAGSVPRVHRAKQLANQQDAKSKFLTDAASVEPYLRKPLVGVQSPYELKAGGFIPVALVTAINSDLPGEVIAQVSQNVFDTVTGEHLLIPQGTRVLGKYQSLVSNGQNRALVVWTRLVMPNGDSIVLEGMPGTDQAGAAGAQDEVDYHLDKLAAAATLSTAIAYGGNLAREGGRDRDNTDVVGETIAQESSKIGGRIIDRQLDVQPTIKIRQGHPLNVLVNKDMILKPYIER